MRKFFGKNTNDTPRRRVANANENRRETVDRQQSATGDENALFRRNRTLTGSLSSRVTSANEHKSDLKSPRIYAHDLTKQRRKIGSILALVAVTCIVLGGVLLQFTARPVVRAADGSIALDAKRYEKSIDDYLSRHPVERLRFVLNISRLNEYLRSTLPEVVSVDNVGSAGFGAGAFTVAVRLPLASWLMGSEQYFVDSEGVSFKLNYYEIPGVRIVDQSGVEQTAGTAIASSRFLNFVGRAVALSKDSGLEVEQAVIPKGTTRQVELRIKGKGFPIKLSLDRSVGEQVEDMKRSIAYFDDKKQSPVYVDVRVSGKAFYAIK